MMLHRIFVDQTEAVSETRPCNTQMVRGSELRDAGRTKAGYTCVYRRREERVRCVNPWKEMRGDVIR